VWLGGGGANVLADYVFACSVHRVLDVAQLYWLDLVVAEDSDDDTAASIVYEMRLFDFELLDTKMAYTSLDEEPDATQRNNLIGCHSLVSDMHEQHLNFRGRGPAAPLAAAPLRRHGVGGRGGGKAEDGAEDAAEHDDPQTPGNAHESDEENEEAGAPTKVYSENEEAGAPTQVCRARLRASCTASRAYKRNFTRWRARQRASFRRVEHLRFSCPRQNSICTNRSKFQKTFRKCPRHQNVGFPLNKFEGKKKIDLLIPR